MRGKSESPERSSASQELKKSMREKAVRCKGNARTEQSVIRCEIPNKIEDWIYSKPKPVRPADIMSHCFLEFSYKPSVKDWTSFLDAAGWIVPPNLTLVFLSDVIDSKKSLFCKDDILPEALPAGLLKARLIQIIEYSNTWDFVARYVPSRDIRSSTKSFLFQIFCSGVFLEPKYEKSLIITVLLLASKYRREEEIKLPFYKKLHSFDYQIERGLNGVRKGALTIFTIDGQTHVWNTDYDDEEEV